MFKVNIFITGFLTLLIFHSCQNKEDNNVAFLEEGFKNPQVENRPMVLWTWMNGYVDTVKMVYELEEMKDKGLRGAIIWDIGALLNPDSMIPPGPAFLGPGSLDVISIALNKSHSLGLDLGISAASSWNSGGEWIGVDNGCKELLSTSLAVRGPSTFEIPLEHPFSHGKQKEHCELISLIAFPENVSKTYSPGEVKVIPFNGQKDAPISWQVPVGKWEILLFYSCNTMQPLVVPSPNSKGLIIDHLSRKATRDHFGEFLSRLEKISTADKKMKFIFLDSYEVEQMLDWTPEFLDEFEKRYQYDPKPYLPILQGYSHFDTLIQKRFEADYSKLVSDLLIENHYGESVKIGDENGIQMITEAGHGGSPRVEPLKALGNSHIPMGEFWNRQRHWVTKEAASAAHIYGKNIVASESLTGWNHWQHGPADFKQLIDIAFCEGMNQVVFHTFSHNPEIAGKPGFVYHAGEHINVNATWWEYARPFMDYIARSSYLLRQGDFVADILMYYGDEAPNLVPPKRIDPNYTPDMPGIFPTFFYDKHKCPHCGRPKPIVHDHLHGYEYDYVNEDIITNSLKSKNGKLVLPHGPSYQVLVLPDREDISLEVLRKLDQLIFEGAIVLGPKPSRATSLKGFPENDREVIDLASKIWGDSDGKKVFSHTYGKGKVYWGKSIEEVLKDSGIQPDLGLKNIDNQDLHIDFVHRRTANEEIYFISNSSQKKEKVKAVFRVNPDMKPELWDAHTGLIQRDVQYSKIDDGIELEISKDCPTP